MGNYSEFSQALKSIRPHYLGMAFFWACSMLTFRNVSLIGIEAQSLDLQTLIVIISFIANATTLLLITSVLESRPSFLSKLKPVYFTIIVSLGLAIIPIVTTSHWILQFPDIVQIIGACTGAALCGIGYGFFWGSYAEIYGTLGQKKNTLIIPLCLVLASMLFIFVSYASEIIPLASAPLRILLICAACYFLTKCINDRSSQPILCVNHSRKYVSSLWSLMGLAFATALLSFLFGLIWQISYMSSSNLNDAHIQSAYSNLIIGVVIIALTYILRSKFDLHSIIKLLFPCVIILFIALPFLWETQIYNLNMLMSGIYAILDISIWFMIAVTAYDYSVSGFAVGGAIRSLSIFSRLFGIGTAYLIMSIPGKTEAFIIAISVAAIYATILLISMLLFLKGPFKSSSRILPDAINHDGFTKSTACEASNTCSLSASCMLSEAEGDTLSSKCINNTANTHHSTGLNPVTAVENNNLTSPAYGGSEGIVGDGYRSGGEGGSQSVGEGRSDNSLEASIKILSEKYELTRRETEVLPYLAKGKTARATAEILFVSENTIKSHTRSILMKMSIHSKQELISLLEQQ